MFERLTARFPDVPVETVRQTVHAIHVGLEGPVRDYVPLLVERAARDALAVGAAPGDRPSTSI